ncbi:MULTISPECIES: STAS domain-containing protein [Streptomyces]|uniref:Anti-sigma factor antagonist n=2 Tax=Streptomyces griseoaurantiacus TaxID=68213 RepID=A0ABZ1V9Y1_9ACTN|nr:MULTISPECIES: STAS domain-containing protein [Streptomyces]MBA5224707.1 STAS domain-containing protein [Streptomyces griseoaurantiacus]MCF0084990.1 Anti-sigma-B factor antagonist [Streptomyces sp. MH192]MCF0098415.1 Anti-sigma-B factor antagonist [Streptomyces sp. MH191]MDX3088440.1 STAS domain-containing protein [Streptomyces sp. ME12-02E]MDX3332031.1 STAS domain-containing protein [Streptomyces sp. ME02-6978a]
MTDALDPSIRLTGDRTAVVAVVGDVDLHTASELRTRAQAVVDQGAPHLVLDMEQVDFVDSTGLTTLIVLLQAAQAAGGSLRVARIPERLVRMVTITGVSQLIPMYDTVDEALAALTTEVTADGAGPSE